MMTQVGFNSLFCQKEKEQRERDVSQTLEVNSIYYKAQRCGFDLFFFSEELGHIQRSAFLNSGGPSHNSTGK